MDLILLNGIGFIAALGSVMIVSHTLITWQGVLREWLYLFIVGFSFFAVGFFWNIFGILGLLPHVQIVFFSLGMIFILWGANKVLAYSGR